METIKNYLEAMFANLPNTAEVRKAKDELFSMMEDKYNELIAEGETENAAIGTVISEFGNLDELAEDLGLTEEVEEAQKRQQEEPRQFVSMSGILEFLDYTRKRALYVAIGVLLCIVSVCFTIIGEELLYNETYGVVGMFGCIIVAVALFIYSGSMGKDYVYLTKEACRIDLATADMVRQKSREFRSTRTWMLTVGVVLCAFCWVPSAAASDSDIMPVTLFGLVGLGVFLMVYSGIIVRGYEAIMNVNDRKTVSGHYADEETVHYVSRFAEAIMSVYWLTITCIYLMVSFLTFEWGLTWIIWPVAAILHVLLKSVLTTEE